MNGYYYTLHRQKYGLNQYQDFIIGAVHKHQAMNVTDIIGMAKEHKVSSLFTTHQALIKSIKQGYLESTASKDDSRYKSITLTTKGKNYITGLNNLFKGKKWTTQNTY
jgi:DNA-binding MarR family transcriptional regulator